MSRHDPTSISTPQGLFGHSPLWLRWLLLVGLIAVELLYLSVQFDTAALSAGRNVFTRLVGDAPIFIRIGLATLAAFLLLLIPRLGRTRFDFIGASAGHGWKRWLAFHLTAYWVFYLTTRQVFELAAQGQDPSGFLLTGWLALGLLLAALWLLAAAPFRYWRALARQEWLAVLAGLVAGIAAWGLGEIAHTLWKPLAASTFWMSRWLLKLFYEDVVYDPADNVLGTPGFMVDIAPECSGYEGMGLILVFLTVYLWLIRSEVRFPKVLLLFPLGAFAMWLANTIRISTLIAIGSSISEAVALGGFHSQAGWIAFSVIAFGVIYLTRRLGLFMKPLSIAPQDHPEDDDTYFSMTAALLVPFLVLMASLMLTSAVSHGFDWLYPLRPVMTAAALWHYRDIYRNWDWSWSWLAVLIGIAVFALWLAMEPESDASALLDGLNALPQWQQQAWLAFRVLGSVVLVPIVEEMAFRGYLLRRLVSPDFDDVPPARIHWIAFLVSSLVFGFAHGRWLAGTLAGMAYAGAVYRRGRLADAVVAHMTTNGLIAVWVLLGERWSLWT